MNKNTFFLALLLSTVSADNNIELGAHLGASGINSFKPCRFQLEKQEDKDQGKEEWRGKSDLKVGFAGRLSLGYVESIENGVFYGIHTFVGWGNGEYSNRDQREVPLFNEKKESIDCEASASLSIKQSWNTGLYGQIGKEYENHRFFGIVGWTLSRFCVSSSLSIDGSKVPESPDIKTADFLPNHRPLLSGSQSQWRNGLSLGAGYAYKVSPKVQVGLTYIATWFPGTFSTQNSLDSRVEENVEKLGGKKEGFKKTYSRMFAMENSRTSTQSLWNHAIYLSVSMALNKSAA